MNTSETYHPGSNKKVCRRSKIEPLVWKYFRLNAAARLISEHITIPKSLLCAVNSICPFGADGKHNCALNNSFMISTIFSNGNAAYFQFSDDLWHLKLDSDFD